MAKIGIIGGSGLYDIEGITISGEHTVDTPFGSPSDMLIEGTFNGKEVVFLPRHGCGHRFAPHEINYRANIFALKKLGVTRIIAVSAVGSMKEDIHPGEIVIIDQFIDRTKMRHQTFYENGIVAHVPFADPICGCLAKTLTEAGRAAGAKLHTGGSYVCIEGPMFSSRAESHVYRGWGASVIGMTNYQEAKLAREAEMCYSTMALVTDFDCWHEGEADVDVTKILAVMRANIATAKNIIARALPQVGATCDCGCMKALAGGIMTSPECISDETRARLKLLIGKYL